MYKKYVISEDRGFIKRGAENFARQLQQRATAFSQEHGGNLEIAHIMEDMVQDAANGF